MPSDTHPRLTSIPMCTNVHKDTKHTQVLRHKHVRRLLGPVVIVHTGNLRIRESGRLRHVNPELKTYITRT